MTLLVPSTLCLVGGIGNDRMIGADCIFGSGKPKNIEP